MIMINRIVIKGIKPIIFVYYKISNMSEQPQPDPNLHPDPQPSP